MEPRSASSQRTRRAVWWMRLAAIALSLLPLVLVEAALRMYQPIVVEAVDSDPLVDLGQTRPLFVLDPDRKRWEIPPDRLNFFRPDSFAAEKTSGSRRVFVLGGSTVQGRPYAIETAFSTWLKLRLQAADPSTDFEVVNGGGVSYASYRVDKVLQEVLDHQPDAIVVYTGHNEFLEDREYAEVRQMGPLRRNLAKLASKLHTVRWIQRALRGEPSQENVMSSEVDARLDHPGGLERYQRDPSWRQGVEQHFAVTLRRMVARTQAANVPLIICVPASDLVNTPPFKVQRLADLGANELEEFQKSWSDARDVSRSVQDRLSACQICLRIDPHHAGANYVAGRLLYEQGATDRARPYLIAARDHDVCPLRATTPIVQAVRSIARSEGIPLVDTVDLLDQRNWQGERIPDAIADPQLFVDHLHPTIAGHQQIGLAVAQQLWDVDGFPTSSDGQSQQAQQRYATLVDEHLAQLGEEYYARGRQRLKGLRRWASGRVGKAE